MKNKLKSLLFLSILALLTVHCEPPVAVTKWTGQTMGTFYNVSIYGPEMDNARHLQIHDGIDSVLQSVNKQMNPWDPGSEISRFNKMTAEDVMEISPDFARVIIISREIYKLSGGAFDPTVGPLTDLWGFGPKSKKQSVPSAQSIDSCLEYIGFNRVSLNDNILKKTDDRIRLDLSAVAKGFGVDAVADYLRSRQFKNFLVEIGGEIVCSGQIHGRNWRLGIDRPTDNALPGEKLSSILSITNLSVATSGDYRNFYIDRGRRYSHTIDPITGKPVTHNLASATIIASECARADAMATACMVMGEQAPDWIESIPDVEGYFIFREEKDTFREVLTSGFEKFIQ
jgi:thiamine biosynthesis lipoprotein